MEDTYNPECVSNGAAGAKTHHLFAPLDFQGQSSLVYIEKTATADPNS